ncbi:hypothetical protein ECDEC4C_0100 [Escherichia coli DEC4C]|nr:hypothetical protein ECDEC4C_0100 [Escherichia coli DEC4C]EIN82145.1 hypothetical protein ECPA10_0282 [Escherichia coli PA10]
MLKPESDPAFVIVQRFFMCFLFKPPDTRFLERYIRYFTKFADPPCFSL